MYLAYIKLIRLYNLYLALIFFQVCQVRSKQHCMESWQPNTTCRLSEIPWAVGDAPVAEGPSLEPALGLRYHCILIFNFITFNILTKLCVLVIANALILTDWTWGNPIFLDIQDAALQHSVGARQEDNQTPPIVIPSYINRGYCRQNEKLFSQLSQNSGWRFLSKLLDGRNQMSFCFC